jgi:hypothetical protein
MHCRQSSSGGALDPPAILTAVVCTFYFPEEISDLDEMHFVR